MILSEHAKGTESELDEARAALAQERRIALAAANREAEARATLGAVAEEMELLVGEIRATRRSHSYQVSSLLRALRSAPRRTASDALKWLTGTRRCGAGLLGSLRLDDPLGAVEERMRAIGTRAPPVSLRAQTEGLEAGHVILFAGVPYDDIGGGQRSAQLARALVSRLFRVTYVHAFAKEGGIVGRVHVPRLEHLCLDEVTPFEILSRARETTTVLFEVPLPRLIPYARLAWRRGIPTIFELIDDWESSLGAGWFDLGAQREFAARCTRTVATARSLVEKLRTYGAPRPEYLPNAADDAVFTNERTHLRPADLPAGDGGTLLYFGSLYGEWFAWDYVRAAAERSPRKAFVLIGDGRDAPSMPPNVHFLGLRLNESLPAYLAFVDAALIPFRPCGITDAVSPIKVFEYLFMQKPVISGALPELEGYPDVHIARDAGEFAELCATQHETSGDASDFISRNTWNVRLDRLLKLPAPKRSFSFIVLIHDNRPVIGRCLRTLLDHTRGLRAETLVVDNASSDGGAELVEEKFPGVKVIRNSRNGCSSGRNLGARHATGDCLVFLDSDQWFTSSAWCHEADELLRRNAGLGALGWAAGWFDGGPSGLEGRTVDFLPARGRQHPEMVERGFRTDVAYLGSGGMFIPRSVWKELEGFDEAYDPTCFEDTDLSFQIRRAGFELGYRDLGGIRHEAHQTTKAARRNPEYVTLLQRNGRYLREKWRDQPEYFRTLDR
jgi:GT2 family glycosyltransferase/glycosyltransferase involved in cell wall biosynthesis